MRRINISLEEDNAKFVENFKEKNKLGNLDNTINEMVRIIKEGENCGKGRDKVGKAV